MRTLYRFQDTSCKCW